MSVYEFPVYDGKNYIVYTDLSKIIPDVNYIGEYNAKIDILNITCSNHEDLHILNNEAVTPVVFYHRLLPMFPNKMPLRFIESILNTDIYQLSTYFIQNIRIMAREIQANLLGKIEIPEIVG